MPSKRTITLVLLLAVAPLQGWAGSKEALKVYVSVDMEGVAGVVSADQLNPSGFEYERFRGFMTDEAVAAVRATLDSGATEVVVSDSHGSRHRWVSTSPSTLVFHRATRERVERNILR
jgi:D-amino peptidase